MAASEGIAKRATIDVGFTDTSFIDNMEKFNRLLKGSNEQVSRFHNVLDHTDQSLSEFSQHMNIFADMNGETMNRIRQHNNDTAKSTERLNETSRRFADTYNSYKDKVVADNDRMDQSDRQRYQNALNNEHSINEALSHEATYYRRNANESAHDYSKLKSQMSGVGNTSSHASDRVASANGRMAHSFRYANGGINRHIQSIRDAQNHDYHWLRTAQAMSLTSLGLGANLYKGAKDVGTLQQSYLHAGNMAHYGGEKIATVQRHINDQWRVGSQLSIKYGVSQDQIAKGFQALVARGYKTNEALHAQTPLLQAAIASGDSYNDVVQGTTNVLDAYNLRSDNAAKMTNNTKEVTDEMAYAADQTASNFKDLSTGMAYVAATAHTTNQPISETSSALGILSNKGMQASMAGVGLRKVLNSFLSINKKGQQAQVMQQLGLNQNSFRTASGHLKSLGQLMTILNNKTKNMGSAERGAIFHRFFGATGQEAALNLASDTSGLKQLNDQVKRSQDMGKNHQGYVALLSAHNMKSAQNQFNVFKQAWQAFMITSAREVLPTFTNALKHADVYLAKMNNLSPRAKKWTIFGALAVAAISPISYAIFGIQSAFHGVELTLLHVRKLFARPVSNDMSNSALKNAKKQESAALLENEKTGRSSYMDQLGQYEFDHPHLTKMRLHRQRLGARMWATNRGALSHITNIGGDASAMASPTLLARLNPFNRSARFFTHQHLSWMPGVHRLPTVTGKNASYLLRGTGTGMMERLGGGLLGKANLVTGIATSLPLVEKGLKWIDHTRIGGKLFAPLNKSLIKGMNGPVKFINRSWRFIKRGALDAIKPIENEWHKMFSSESKSSRANLRGLKEFVNISTRLIGGLFRTISKVAGNVLKYGGHAIAGIMRTLRGLGTLAGGVADIFTGHWKRAFHLLTHGANLTFSGLWNTVSNVIKGVGTSLGDMFNGLWSTMKKVGHGMIDSWHHIFNDLEDIAYDVIKDVGNWISDLGSKISYMVHHPIKSLENLSGKVSEPVHSHAAGGAIPHNEMSLVNEKGQESAYNPIKNTFRLLGNNGPQVIKLYQGEHVLDAQDTHELLNGGLGRGVTLPGYSNGTDKLNNLKPIHGYINGRGNRIAAGVAQNKVNPSQVNSLTSDIEKGIPKGDDFHDAITKDTGYLGDAFNAYDVLHGPVKGIGHRATDLLGDIGFSKAGATLGAKLPGTAPTKAMGAIFGAFGGGKLISGLRNHFPRFSHYLNQAQGAWFMPKNFKAMEREYAHSGIGKFLSPKGMKHHINAIKRMGRNGLRGIRSFGRKALRGARRIGSNAWRGIRRFGRGTMRFGRRMFHGGRRLLSRAGHGLARFGRSTWSRAKRLGRNLWSGTKRVARRMWSATKRTGRRMWRSARRTGRHIWNSAKRVGRNVWNDSKRVARNVGRAARSLWNRTKRGASNTWSRVVSGARRMASHVKSLGSRAWSAIKNGARDAKSVADSMLSGIISFAHRAAHAIKEVVTLGGMIGHHANGGRIMHNQLSLVGERGPEAAYNARTGSIRMLGLNGPQITELIAGEAVLTNAQTNRLLHGGLGRGTHLPAYAKGTNARLSGPASRSSVFNITGAFHGKQALENMRTFNKHAKDIWDDVSSHITDGSQSMSKAVTKTNSDLSDTTRDIFKEMSKKVNDLTDDLKSGLIQAAHDMAEGFGDKFKKLITYAKEDMESVIDKLNRGVTGIDHALRAFGGNSHVIHPIHYATGTMNGRIAYDQLGILNDAISGPRQEAILRGNQLLMPQGDNVPVPLQKGDAVLNGDQTKELINNTTVNHYAKGSGLHINFKHLNALVKTIGLALKGPAAFFKKTFSHLIGEPTGHQLTKGLEETGLEAVKPLGVKWTRAMFSFIHSILSPDNGASASASEFLNYAEQHRPSNYVFGGAPGLNDTDCSGFIEACLQHFGISAPRTSGAQIAHFQHITRSEARPGDLLGTGDHIGIVADNGAHHYFSNHGPNGAHPAAGMDPYVPSAFPGGAASFARVPQLAKFNKPKHKKIVPFLQRLVAHELGAHAIHWLKALAPMLSNGSGSGAGLASGNGVIATAWNEFAKLGMTPTQIMGALGGAKQESGFNPTAYDPDGGLGLFQATPPYGNLRAYAAAHHENWKDPAVQAKQYYEHWLKPGGYLSTHGSLSHEAYEAASIEAHSHIDSGLAPDSDFGVRLAGAHEIQRWYESHKHANGGWANSPAIFGEDGPEVAINPARDTADHYIIEAINARMHHNPNSPIANLIHSIAIRKHSGNLRNAISGLMNKVTNPNQSSHHKSINININFGDIVVNNNGGNFNTGALANKIKRAAKQAIMRAAYESSTKLD